jgi:aminoglycoside phosphotransferase (APT) family kinase protein
VTVELVPERELRAWLDDRVPGTGAFAVQRVTSGHSNEMFRLERGGHAWMLRRPPRVLNAPGAHDMAREFLVLEALAGSGVPHAEPVALCEDPAVIGAPFYVMGWIDGVRPYDGLPRALDGPDARAGIAYELFDALADLHNLDWKNAGLDGFGRPEGFAERQVPRWTKQLTSYQTRALPDLTAAGAWLADHVPAMQRPALIHGDYGLHNVLFADRIPVRMLAVVDWETATIGDPLMDAGYLLALWLEGDEPQRWSAAALPYDVAGYPARKELAARYADRTGLDLGAIDWYRAMTLFKVACILEGGYTRYRQGATDDPGLAHFETDVPNLAAYALAVTRGEA